MNFVKHLDLKGFHAILSPSTYHWIRYTIDKFDEVYRNKVNAAMGDRLHAVASELINLGIKLPNNSKTLNQFVNDAIGYRMTSEQILFYSENCFGTADAISYRKNVLRIHDLKTGITRTSMDQLLVYAALFCLEYDIKPSEIKTIELRIYKNDDVEIMFPGVDDIIPIMDQIITLDGRIEILKMEALGVE